MLGCVHAWVDSRPLIRLHAVGSTPAACCAGHGGNQAAIVKAGGVAALAAAIDAHGRDSPVGVWAGFTLTELRRLTALHDPAGGGGA